MPVCGPAGCRHIPAHGLSAISFKLYIFVNERLTLFIGALKQRLCAAISAEVNRPYCVHGKMGRDRICTNVQNVCDDMEVC